VLSLGRTIREALRDGAADVLVCLAGAGGLQDVLGVLSPEDARAIYQVCREEVEQAATAAAMRKWTGVLLELWRDKPLRSEEENLYRDGLWMLALAGAHHAGAMPDGDFMTSLDGLLNLRRVLRPIRSADIFDRLIRTLAASDLGGATALAITAGSENSYAALQFFSEMMQGDADWGAQAAGVLLNEDFRRESTASEPLRDQTILSRFGGIFSLGPSLVTLGFEATGADAAALRHLIAVKCLGGERARETASDPAVRLFSGFTGAFSEALEALENSSALVELKHLLLGRYRGTSLVAEPVILPGGEAVLFRDVDENDWIWATAGGTEVPRGLKTTPRSDFKPAQPHVSYFSLGVCWPGIPFSLELIGTIAARAVLRHFARRLIGFSASRPDHLYTNFLAGRTTIEDTGYRLEVEIMPPPLSVVLRMAGIHNEVYHAPWIGREVWLRQTSE
jgi:hypothetical protein